jgi:glucans biosynthesis protein
MFLFGEEAPASFGDFRPEVHDSDGLLLRARDGEWLFRPLRNPQRTTRSQLRLDSPRGFGLLQRDREFASYQDLEARYERRPSAWVEPVGDWGPGALHLLEIASRSETHDNVAMAWVPDKVPEQGLSLRYRIHFGAELPGAGPTGTAIATRLAETDSGRRFVVDFRGHELPHAASITAHVDVRGGRIVEQHVVDNAPASAVRLSFEVVAEPEARDVELRAFLRSGPDVLTETWSFLWQPNP